MSRKITGLREERASAFEAMKAVSEKAEAEGRDLNAEETQEYERMSGEFDGLTARVDRLEREEGIAPQMTRSVVVEDEAVQESRVALPALAELRSRAQKGDKLARREYVQSDEYADAFRTWMKNPLGSDEVPGLTGEQRAAMAIGTGAAGLYTVPKEFLAQLTVSEREFGVIRQLATVISTSGSGLMDVPTVSSTRATAAWTAEAVAYTESEDSFGQVQLAAYKAAVIAKLSEEIVHDSAFDVLGFVARSCGEALGVLENTSYVSGASGSTTTPEGLLTKATVGVTLTTGQTTAITSADSFIDLYHSLLSPYRTRASWIINDATIKQVRKFKDSTNQYIWSPGIVAGQPDTLLNRPVYSDPDVAVMAANALVCAFGDIKSAYMIRDVEGVQAQVLNELYAATGQVGFRVHKRTDGDLVDALAVKTLKASAT